MRYALFSVLFVTLALSACQSVIAQSEKDSLLIAVGPEVQNELSETVAKMLGIKSVLLSAKDLTKTSYLPVERVRLIDPNGLLVQGIETEKPNTFKLVKKDDICWLLHLNTGRRAWLKTAQCKVVN